jgi:hypothetical protein
MAGTLAVMSAASAVISAEEQGIDPVEAVKNVLNPLSSDFLSRAAEGRSRLERGDLRRETGGDQGPCRHLTEDGRDHRHDEERRHRVHSADPCRRRPHVGVHRADSSSGRRDPYLANA